MFQHFGSAGGQYPFCRNIVLQSHWDALQRPKRAVLFPFLIHETGLKPGKLLGLGNIGVELLFFSHSTKKSVCQFFTGKIPLYQPLMDRFDSALSHLCSLPFLMIMGFPSKPASLFLIFSRKEIKILLYSLPYYAKAPERPEISPRDPPAEGLVPPVWFPPVTLKLFLKQRGQTL